MKSLKEKWERSIQSVRENGEKEIGGSSIITEGGKYRKKRAFDEFVSLKYPDSVMNPYPPKACQARE